MRLIRPREPLQVKVHESEDLLTATLGLAQTQLMAQIADETSIDGRTMGLLAFNGALLAADVGAKDVLGPRWWTVLVAVSFAALPCLWSIVSRETDLGPLASMFYATYGGHESIVARKQLLADLGASFTSNTERIKNKRRRLRTAIFLLTLGLVVASASIALDRPSRISNHAPRISKSSTATASPGLHAGAVAAATRWYRRHPPLAFFRFHDVPRRRFCRASRAAHGLSAHPRPLTHPWRAPVRRPRSCR